MTLRRACLVGGVLLLVAMPLLAWPLPVALETRHLVGPGRPLGPPPVELRDELYLLAMSASNQAAFLEHRVGVSGGATWVSWVQDLVTDDVSNRRTWQDDAPLEDWWPRHGDEVTQDFARRGLEDPGYQLGEFPVILDEEFLTVVLRTSSSATRDGHLDRLEVVVRSSTRGIKTVYDAQGDWLWARILGFLPSPYENRLALVLLVQPSGWAGPNQPLRFVVTGVSLKAGFDAP